MSHKRILLDIADLNINIENPRFEMVGNQREAIKTIIEDQGDKLSKLAEDIVDEGLNPGDPIFVIKHEKQTRQSKHLETVLKYQFSLLSMMLIIARYTIASLFLVSFS